jgi:hypothetical protein
VVGSLDRIHAVEALNLLLPELFVLANRRTEALPPGCVRILVTAGRGHVNPLYMAIRIPAAARSRLLPDTPDSGTGRTNFVA